MFEGRRGCGLLLHAWAVFVLFDRSSKQASQDVINRLKEGREPLSV